MTDFTLWDLVRNLLLAARWTLLLSAIAFVGGGIVGLALLLVRIGRNKWGRTAVMLYVELFQSTPLLMQLFLVYFGLPKLGIDVSAWLAAAVCLTLYSSAFLTDIWRGSVEAIPRGQWDGSASLGLALSLATAPGDPAASHAHGHSADRRLSGAIGEKHGARLNRRLPRTDQDGADPDQCHLPAFCDLRARGADLFCHLLSADEVVARARTPLGPCYALMQLAAATCLR